jgi:hypothetical protein
MFYRDTFNFSAAVDNCKRTWGVTPRSKSWPVTQVGRCGSFYNTSNQSMTRVNDTKITKEISKIKDTALFH